MSVDIGVPGGGHVCEIEFVPSSEEARAIYVVFDGRRIAARGRIANGDRGWVSLVASYDVVDVAPDQFAVFHFRDGIPTIIHFQHDKASRLT